MKKFIVYWYEKYQDNAVIERGFSSKSEARERAKVVSRSLRVPVSVEEDSNGN